MKNMSLLQKILAIFACCLCVVIIAVGVHGVMAYIQGTAPVGGPDENDYEFVFIGNITLLEQDYTVHLKGKDGVFQLDAGNIKNVMDGKYTFTEGQGWTLTFNDNMGTVVRSMYDKNEKSSSFIYALNLGSRGEGNLRFICEDPSFKADAVCWEPIPSFNGTATWFGGVLSAAAVTSCDADGNFRIFCTGGEVTEIIGTYELVDDAYIFTSADGATYTAQKDPATGLYTFTATVFRPALASYGPIANAEVVFTQTVLTVD